MATITCRAFRLGQVWANQDYIDHSGQDFTHIGDGIILNLLEGDVVGVYLDTDTRGNGVTVRVTQATWLNLSVKDSLVHYYHMSEAPYVSVGQHVIIGEPLGHQGDTGRSDGVHLHVGFFHSNGNNRKAQIPIITGVPYQPIGSVGTLYDNDYDPENLKPEKIKPRKNKLYIMYARRRRIYGFRF